MIKKKLPVVHPPVIGILIHAFYLSILLNNKESLPWFYNNYIQLRFLNDFVLEDRHYLDFYDGNDVRNCPFIEEIKIASSDIINSRHNFSDFIMDNINKGYYVRFEVDEFYLPNRRAYKELHFSHSIMINGYDYGCKIYNVSGIERNGDYSNSTVSFSEFEEGFFSDYNYNISFTPIILVKMKENITSDFDLGRVIGLLNDYLYSKDSTISFPSPVYWFEPSKAIFGMDTYKYLKIYYEKLIEKKVLSDIRPIHFLWEHKKCIVQRIKYLQENRYLSEISSTLENYVLIEKKVSIIRNLMLKYIITYDNKLIDRIVQLLSEVEVSEYDVASRLLSELEQN